MPRSILILMAVILAAIGCAAETTAVEPLRIAAASDLQQVLPEIATRFELRHQVKVVCTFGSSGQLAEQLKAGAPFDLFLAANQRYVTDLAKAQVIASESVAPYARGELVLIVGDRANEHIGQISDLSKSEIRSIALANPQVAPYGKAAKETLEKAGLWSSVETKVVQAENVRQVLQFVTSGNAEAGFVGSALVRGVEGLKIVAVDPELYAPLVQYLGVIARSQQPEHAAAFREFLLGAEGQAMLRDHGFQPADLR